MIFHNSQMNFEEILVPLIQWKTQISIEKFGTQKIVFAWAQKIYSDLIRDTFHIYTLIITWKKA